MKTLSQALHVGVRQWNQFWFSCQPDKSYRLFRIVHGLSLTLFLAAWWRHSHEWLTPEGFHFPDEAILPLPSKLLPWFAALQFGSLSLFIIGWKPRLTAMLSWLCLAYVTLIDSPAAYSINSIFLFTFAVLALVPSSSGFHQILVTPVRLLQLGMVAIYFSSGWHKIVFGDWLSSPHVLESSLKGVAMTDAASWFLRTFPALFWTLAQAFVLAFELFSPVLFFSKRLWLLAICYGCLFHLSIALFMHQFIYFSLQMMSFYVLFVPCHRLDCFVYSPRRRNST